MEFLNQKSKDLVNVFTTNLLSTNRSFNYYVNWANIDGYKGFLVEIHAMDVLIGCKDESFKSQFFTLISKLPNVRLLFPFLFGLAKSEREQLYRGKNKLKSFNMNWTAQIIWFIVSLKQSICLMKTVSRCTMIFLLKWD